MNQMKWGCLINVRGDFLASLLTASMRFLSLQAARKWLCDVCWQGETARHLGNTWGYISIEPDISSGV